MKERKFIIKSWPEVHDLLSNWFRIPIPDNGLEIVIREITKKRTNPQNNYYWDLLSQVSEQAELKHSPEVWHEYFKRTFLPDVCAKGIVKWAEMPNQDRFLNMGTKDLSTVEFMDYVQEVEAFVVYNLDVQIIDKRYSE